jgi:hypothetical protein
MSTSERVVCASCSANNFATQAACWKCGKSLSMGATPVNPPSAPPLQPTPYGQQPSPAIPMMSPSPEYVSPGVATAAAVVMGLFFPAFSIPLGIAFLMLDNKRKIAIGWQNIIWGIVGTVLNIIISTALFTPVMTYLFTKALSGQSQSGTGLMQKIQQQQNTMQELSQ